MKVPTVRRKKDSVKPWYMDDSVWPWSKTYQLMRIINPMKKHYMQQVN